MLIHIFNMKKSYSIGAYNVFIEYLLTRFHSDRKAFLYLHAARGIDRYCY